MQSSSSRTSLSNKKPMGLQMGMQRQIPEVELRRRHLLSHPAVTSLSALNLLVERPPQSEELRPRHPHPVEVVPMAPPYPRLHDKQLHLEPHHLRDLGFGLLRQSQTLASSLTKIRHLHGLELSQMLQLPDLHLHHGLRKHQKNQKITEDTDSAYLHHL